jgi:hypothetical protein
VLRRGTRLPWVLRGGGTVDGAAGQEGKRISAWGGGGRRGRYREAPAAKKKHERGGGGGGGCTRALVMYN